MSTNYDSTINKKKWCVMVYFAADIDLESAAVADLNQMKAAGSSDQVDLLAQINPGGIRTIRRYHLQKDTYLQEDLIPILGTDGNESVVSNANAREDLIAFVRWCADRSKAEHYALILWGHGQGWKADNPDPCFVPGAGNPGKTLKETSEMLRTMNPSITTAMPASLPITLPNGETAFLSNDDLRSALAESKNIVGKNIDILGFDACLMAMAETCCQIDESVDYLIACEDTVPDESWPYDSILKVLVANADRMTPEDFARVVLWKFVFDFGQKRKFVTQSFCQLGGDKQVALTKFTCALQCFVMTMLMELKDPEVRWAAMVARSQVQSFFMKDYVDLFDYCRLLSANCKSAMVVKACEDVMNALRPANSNNNGSTTHGLVVDNGTYGYTLKSSFGVSVYFPCTGQIPGCYPKLEFCQKTRWHEFLAAFLVSPAGRPAVFEAEWPDVIGDNQPPQPPVTPTPEIQPGIFKEINLTTTTAAAPVLAGTGVVLSNGNGNVTAADGNGVKTTLGDVIKTTYGDVIKTSHGDPIKTPQLPTWMLPSAPKLKAPVDGPTDPNMRGARIGDQVNCGCGQKH